MGRPSLPLGTWGKITRKTLPDGRCRARARYRDYDGVTRVVERFATSEAKAERKLVEALATRSRPAGTVVDITAETTIGDLADLWLAKREDGDYAIGTLDNDRGLITNHIKPSLGRVRIREATTGVLDAFIRSVATDSRSAQCRIALTGMMNLAAQHDAIDRNPMAATTKRSSTPPPARALTVDELQQLRVRIAAWSGTNQYGPKRGPDFPDLADCLIGSGGRISEVLAFQWPNIEWATDLTPARVWVGGKINKNGKFEPNPKSEGSKHWLIIPDFMVAALQRQKERALPGGDLDLVWPGRGGEPRTTANTRRQFRDARRFVVYDDETGKPDGPEDMFEWVTPKTFRKTVATLLADTEGVEAAADQLGHSSPDITRKHYWERHRSGPDVRHILDRLAPVSGGFKVAGPRIGAHWRGSPYRRRRSSLQCCSR